MRGQMSREDCNVVNRGCVRNVGSGFWDQTVTVIEEVQGSDGVASCFTVRMDGCEIGVHRHKVYLHHLLQ